MSRVSRALSLVVELDSGEAVSGVSGRIQPGAFGLAGYERDDWKANRYPGFDLGIGVAPGQPGEEGRTGGVRRPTDREVLKSGELPSAGEEHGWMRKNPRKYRALGDGNIHEGRRTRPAAKNPEIGSSSDG